MQRLIRATAFTWLILHLLASAALGSLRDDIDRLVRTAPLKGATIAVSIRDCGSGAAMISINPEAPMIPASNMKLLTTGAALHALGPNFNFTTKLLRSGDRLIIVGDGDPAFGDPVLLKKMMLPNGSEGVDVESFLNFWVQPVIDSGIKQISEVVVDDRIFDREYIHPTWPVDQLNNDYCAQVTGMNFHANVLQFYPRPRAGEPPIIMPSRPEAPWLKLVNNATSRDGAGEKTTLGIDRKQGSNDLTFRGNVRTAFRDPLPVTVHDMPDFLAHLLADRLSRAGIKVGGHRTSLKDDPVSTGDAIGPVITTPISTAIKRCNTDSENLYAECLLKRIGYALTGEPGSWTNGAAIARHIIHERLDDPSLASGILIADGSGLSADNRITAAAMTAWLNSFHNDQKLGPIFLESMAIAGQTGTLQNRFGDSRKLHGARVQAKTGYINSVSCLSGFVTMPDGRCRSFSILVNGINRGTVGLAKKLQDDIVSVLADDMAQQPAMQLGSD